MKRSLSLLLVVILLGLGLLGNISCKKKESGDKKDNSQSGNDKSTTQIPEKVLQKLGVLKTPVPQASNEIPQVYGPGISHLASLAGVVEMYDDGLVVADVIFYSGPIYEQWKENKDGKEVTVRGPMRPSTLITSTSNNLGFKTYIGCNKSGYDELNKYYKQVLENGRYQQFKDEQGALLFLKRLVSSGIPVMAYVDMGVIGEVAGGQYIDITSFDSVNIYINESYRTAAEGGMNRALKTEDFLKVWSFGDAAITPNLIFFFEQYQVKRPDVELLASIKKESKNISKYLKADADKVEKGDISIVQYQSFGSLGGAKRSSLAIYFKSNSYEDLGNTYSGIAKQYADLRSITDPKQAAEKYREIAKLEEKASASWQ